MKTKRNKFSRYGMYTGIENFIKSKKLLPGKCLLIGDSLKGKGNSKLKIRNAAITNMLPKGTTIDAPTYPDVDIHKMPYKNDTFDYVIADQVLEHVRKPWIGVEEVRRVLKPGGLTILTSALIFPVHGVPHDYWRFTPDGLRVLCENFSKIHRSQGTGNLNFVMDVLNKRGGRQVTRNTDLEKRAVACDNKHLVSVWIIAEK